MIKLALRDQGLKVANHYQWSKAEVFPALQG
jgi:hypothetical protein